jgi:uncharacterized protein (DUF362 family)
MNPSRRDSLKLLAAASASASLLGGGPLLAAAVAPDLVKVTGADPGANVRKAIELLGGISRFVSKGDKVVIKPNMGFGNEPEKATTTEPRVVRAIAELALQAGAKRVMVLDNPCWRAGIVLEVCGVKQACADLDDTFVLTITDEDFYREVAIPKGVVLSKQQVALDVLEADTLINVPAAKSHSAAKVTFGLKNWMGAVYARRPWHTFYDLNKAIADLATLIRPKLTVVDATRALLTGGPGGPGRIAQLDTVLAGTDPVAVDSLALSLGPFGGSGYAVEDIRYLMLAQELGVGTTAIDTLKLVTATA